MKASVIICTKNEKQGLRWVLERMPQDYEVIVVDSSSDETPLVAQEYNTNLIIEKGKGKGRAMKTGVDNASSDIVIFMDGDGTDDPGFLDEIVDKMQYHDIIFGIKDFIDVPNGFFRALHIDPSKSFPLFTLIGLECDDALTGYRAIRKEDFYALDLLSNNFVIETEWNIKGLQKGMSFDFVVVHGGKRLGTSKFLQSAEQYYTIIKMLMDAYKNGLHGGVCPVCDNNTYIYSQFNPPRCIHPDCLYYS